MQRPSVFFISHGGGPCLLGDANHAEMRACLEQVAATIPKPRYFNGQRALEAQPIKLRTLHRRLFTITMVFLSRRTNLTLYWPAATC